MNQVISGLAGRSPMVTWEFSNYSLATINSGGADAYIDSWANGMATYAGHTIYLRIFHEFNDPYNPLTTTGYPWGVCGGTSNTVSQLITAYRHIHDRFALAGATNVKFIWSPDGTFTSSSMYGTSSCGTLASTYPGDAYVDYGGWDSYNYDNSALYSVQSTITTRPFILSEVGDQDGSGGASWLTNLSNGSYPRITGLVWFNQYGTTLETNPITLAAVKAMLATAAFLASK
jgi:beta-mannanase